MVHESKDKLDWDGQENQWFEHGKAAHLKHARKPLLDTRTNTLRLELQWQGLSQQKKATINCFPSGGSLGVWRYRTNVWLSKLN